MDNTKDNRPKILFFTPTLGGGGAEKVLVNLLNNIDTDKYNVTLLAIFGGGINYKFLSKKINSKYIFPFYFKGLEHLLKIFSPSTLYFLFIKDKYDIVISYQEGITTRILSGCKYSDTKKINWNHGELKNAQSYTRFYRSLNEMRKCYSKYDLFVAVSNTIADSFKKHTNITNLNFRTIYNTILSSEIRTKSKEIISDIVFNKNKTNLITAGRLVKVKGFDRLLECINKLVVENSIVDLHLYILGEGSLRKEFETFIVKNKLSEFITLLGYKENPYKYIAAADLFVCSSYREGFSTAISESLIVGTPVITTLCSGMKEMLGDDEYGYIVKNDTESLYKGLLYLLEHKELLKKYTQKAKERAYFFTTKTRVKDVEDLLDQLLVPSKT